MKLRMKIQLFSSLFMLVLILLINTAIYFMFDKISTKSELDNLAEETNTLVETLQANPDIPKRELLGASLRANSMIRIYEANAIEPSLIVTKENDFRALNGKFSDSESKSIIKDESGLRVAIVSKPIIWDDGEIVALENSEFLVNLQGAMKTLIYVLVIASLLMLIPTIIGGALLSRFLLRPIQLLTDTMRENMRKGTWRTMDLENRSQDELYEMEKTFNEMIDQLKSTFEKQEVFVSDASHELKTPIAIVKSYAQLLARQGQEHPDLFDESVEAIDSEADRMQKLVEQLLQLAKNKNDVIFTEVDMTVLCKKVIGIFNGAYDRDIEVEMGRESLVVHGIEDQLQQVLYILIDNALKYSDDEIKIDVSATIDQVHVQIVDQGPGITEKDQQYIFDRFYRVDKARSRDTGGAGLGLSIARTIATGHQGDLIVHNNPGKGSTFLLTLPIIRES